MMHPSSPASWFVRLAIVVAVATGCGGDDGAGSDVCSPDYYASCIDDEVTAGSRGQCADFYGDAEVLVASCDDATASRRATPCDASASLGGCAITAAGFCTVVWQYDPSGSTTPAEVQAACEASGSLYVAAP
ncbi:MAG: hypothetical protein KA297_17335 [Kofleriaceae bacterium]|nr:hypothetical protein [Kofleriaceae bacterium]MBP6837997.1 hypothetical protein [Kofleriaceae bacterium]